MPGRHVLIGTLGMALLLAAIIGAMLFRQNGAGADASDAALVARGASVYARHCASCHGARLEGQPNWRERLPNGRLPAPPHDETGHTWHHPDAQLFALTKNGLAGVLPNYESDMPAFADVLSDAEIWAVLAFIKSTWPADIRGRQAGINERAR